MADPDFFENGEIESGKMLDIGYYVGLLLRYRWLIIIPFFISMIVGIYLAVTLPREYEAQTLILVESQKVPSQYVRSIVSSDIGSRISTISQQIKSRTRLTRIIKQFKLFSEPRYDNMYMDDKLEEMRKRIRVSVSRYRNTADAFTISFRWDDPDKVVKVVNALTSYFINENLKVRESYAIGTKDFLGDELAKMKTRLESLEKALKDYRTKYMGELPEQLDSNLRMLDRLQEHLSEKQQALRDAKNRLALLETQIKDKKNDFVAESSSEGPVDLSKPTSVDQLKRMLANLQMRYTDQHPDVIRLKKMIREMERTGIPAESSGTASTGKPDNTTGGPPGKEDMGTLSELALQARALRVEILEIGQEIRNLTKQIRMYQKRVENTPKREQELFGLKRDYQNVQDLYNSMLARKLEADIAVNMEKQQKGEQFRVIDPAARPDKPVSPNMKMLFGAVLALGLGLGGGLVLLKDFMDHSIKKPEQLESTLGIPVLATIPAVIHPRDKFLKRLNMVSSFLAILASLGMLACFAAVSIMNYEPVVSRLTHYLKLYRL